MNRHLLFLILSAATLTLTSCEEGMNSPRDATRDDTKPYDGANGGDPTNGAPGEKMKSYDDNTKPYDATNGDDPAGARADNTGRNERDRDGATQTPFDQSESGPDIQITAQIRRAVVAADDLSANADNVKIMTSGGVVTLRGPVASDAESASIEAMAKAVVGVSRVDNQLEVQAR